MPQLSLYIDKETLRKIEIAAKLENQSISKYVVGKLNESFENAWPANFASLFGAIQDETFQASGKLDFDMDSAREGL